MKYLIALFIVSSVTLVNCGCSSAQDKAKVGKAPVSNSQFKGSDHMPPAALAAKRAAGY